MTTASTIENVSELDRYRNAEARLWEDYGLAPRERFIEIDSPRVSLRVLELGPPDGEPVVFIGGTGGTGPYWAPLVRGLDEYRCLLIDRPGWGLSGQVDWRGRPYTQTLTALVLGSMRALHVDRAAIAGASIGATWALRVAQAAPERVASVLLLGPGPLVDAVEPPRFIRLLASPLGAVMVRMHPGPDRVRSIMRQIGHGSSLAAGRIPDSFIEWRVAFERYTGALANERSMVRTLLRGSGWADGLTFSDAELAGIQQPVLLVFGSSDNVGTIDVWRRFTGTLPAGRLEVIDGGHVPWLDDPDRVTAVVRDVLRGRAAA
jgi:pimeloyl-ACP methyl ester carboxylesterase